ncbi:hypothetical protein PG999_005528 [Apiospora kogelbergensis]|uniref:Heterokaryon incompatibility domain-containing protein n=1 Tax=Apiospora kogelbergensis TaxID=1337665 RepID=A0AAW0R2E9_9PEZI
MGDPNERSLKDEEPIIPLILMVCVVRADKRELRITPQFKFYYTRKGKPHLHHLERWTVDYFDIELLKRWISRCDNVHQDCEEGWTTEDAKSTIVELPHDFRVIDVINLNICQPTGTPRFIALSYMWKSGGTGDFQLQRDLVTRLEAPGSLAEVGLPGILTDAMSLCKDMGEKYLWVDRLCIVQDDLASKMEQIQNMDAIYRSATLTIAAALNNNDGTGLPGYKNRPRYPNPSVPRVCTTRGWTFQERLLSRRIIFVTEHEVRFECPEARASEMETWSYKDIELVPHVDHLRRLRCGPEEAEDWLRLIREEEEVTWSHGYVSSQVDSKELNWAERRPPNLWQYCTWVEEYTRRELTYPSDILNAFSGPAKVVSSSFGSRMLFGLPERYLPQALMWGPASSEVADPGVHLEIDGVSIPSWSWARWAEPVQYRWMGSPGTIYLTTEYGQTASIVACFYYHDPEGSGGDLRKLDVEQKWVTEHVDMTELKSVADLPLVQPISHPNWPPTNDAWEQCPQSPWEAIAHQDIAFDECRIANMLPGCLVFNTTVASVDQRFRLVGRDHLSATIRGRKGVILGYLECKSSDQERIWAQRGIKSEGRVIFDFIVVCALVEMRTTEKPWLRGFSPDHDRWWLRVMLVERISMHPYIARKVGAGEIRMSRWKDFNPRWETVILW